MKVITTFFIVLSISFLIILSVIFFVSADENLIIQANIIATDEYLNISIYPNNISFGNVYRGDWFGPENVNVTNSGNVDISVTPQLSDDYSGGFFNNTVLKKCSGGYYELIGQFDFNMGEANPNPTIQCISFRLDLRNYTTPIYQNIVNHTSTIKIVAVPQ